MAEDPKITKARNAAVRAAREANPDRRKSQAAWDAYARAIDAVIAKYGKGPNWGKNMAADTEGGTSFLSSSWILILIAGIFVVWFFFGRKK